MSVTLPALGLAPSPALLLAPAQRQHGSSSLNHVASNGMVINQHASTVVQCHRSGNNVGTSRLAGDVTQKHVNGVGHRTTPVNRVVARRLSLVNITGMAVTHTNNTRDGKGCRRGQEQRLTICREEVRDGRHEYRSRLVHASHRDEDTPQTMNRYNTSYEDNISV